MFNVIADGIHQRIDAYATRGSCRVFFSCFSLSLFSNFLRWLRRIWLKEVLRFPATSMGTAVSGSALMVGVRRASGFEKVRGDASRW